MSADSLRLFVAIDVPDAWRAALAGVQDRLERVAPGFLRRVDPKLMHLTLAFLGYQPTERLPSIEEAMRAVAERYRPFALRIGRLGFFGSPGQVRVVWASVEAAPGMLEGLHGALVAALKARGIDLDERPLVPHITLGRGQRERDTAASRRIAEAVSTMVVGTLAPHLVTSLVLYRSDLRPQGPLYTALRTVPLDEEGMRAARKGQRQS